MGVTYGELSGAIKDESLNPVPYAVVQALSGGVIKATTFSDNSGGYTLWVSAAGTYDIRVSAIGSATNTVSGQMVSAASNTIVNLSLVHLPKVAGTVQDTSGSPLA